MFWDWINNYGYYGWKSGRCTDVFIGSKNKRCQEHTKYQFLLDL